MTLGVGIALGTGLLVILLIYAHTSSNTAMRLTDLVRDAKEDRMSLTRVVTIWTALMVGVGFLKEAWVRGLTWDDYLGVAVGLAVSASPALASKIISLKYSGGNGAPSGGKALS